MTTDTKIQKFRKELENFIKRKDLRKGFQTYQTKAKELLQMTDQSLLEWCNQNEVHSYIEFAINDYFKKADKSKYQRLHDKILDEGDDVLTEAEIEFIQLYEEENNIEETIL